MIKHNGLKLAAARAAEHRAAFNVQVQAGRTAHGIVRQWTPDEIAALNAERGSTPPPQKAVKLVLPPPKPKVERRVIKLPPKPRPTRKSTDGSSIREQIAAVLADGALRSAAEIADALPDRNRDSVRYEVKNQARVGLLQRYGEGHESIYGLASNPPPPKQRQPPPRKVASTDGTTIRERILALFKDATLTTEQVVAALPDCSPMVLKAELSEQCRAGTLQRVKRGIYRTPQPDEVPGMLDRAAFLAVLPAEVITAAQINALFPKHTPHSVHAQLMRCVRRGDVERVSYGVYRRKQ